MAPKDARPGALATLSSLAAFGILKELGPAFEQGSGCRLQIRFDPASVLVEAIEAGEPFDLAILTAPLIERLTERGVIARGTRADFASSGIGVAVRAGAPKPDIATSEAFLRALREARSVAYTLRGASGQAFARLIERLGVAEEVNAKALVLASGFVGDVVARGEAELGIQQISEILPIAGAELVGPLPPEYQQTTVFSAGIAAQAADPEMARALVARLTAESTARLIRAKGLDPV